VHLSPLDGKRALSDKLRESGAALSSPSNLAALCRLALKILDKGLLASLIVCRETIGARSAIRRRRFRTSLTSSRSGSVPGASMRRGGKSQRDDVALLQYTAAPPGLPKGAMLSHGNRLRRCDL